ncbi:MAG: flagellar assembly factor FliW [Candidatus Eremiobacteraeota bacterium]|jgi:flagellar assembly factor FliW|nr:flagellar assembly factor FliW [Candidatus Eremiobacteraeota bacterium]
MVDTTDREITAELPRFGTCTFRESEVLTFPWGLPGFGTLRRFIALNLEGQEKFVWLQSLDDHSVALPTADPWQIFAEYAPHLPPYAISSLDLNSPDDFATLCVVVVTPGAAEMTMNLLAPIIVNLRTRQARQVTLETGGYSVRTPIPRKAPAATAGA